MPMAENPENKQRWYALRVTYGREMLVKGYLDGIGVESYIPMHFARRTYGAVSYTHLTLPTIYSV